MIKLIAIMLAIMSMTISTAAAASAMSIFFLSTFAVMTNILSPPVRFVSTLQGYAEQEGSRTEELWSVWTNSCVTAERVHAPR